MAERPMLVPDLNGGNLSYIVYGPLVFFMATHEYQSLLNNADTLQALSFVRSPLLTRRGDAPDAEPEGLVLASSGFFPHKLAQGYSNPSASVLYLGDGVRVRSLH